MFSNLNKYLIILWFSVFCIKTYLMKKNYSSNNKETNPREKFKILSKGKNYIEKCLKSLFKKKNYKQVIKPLISVIIPIYNTGRYLDDSIGSLINQTIGFKNIQIRLSISCLVI